MRRFQAHDRASFGLVSIAIVFFFLVGLQEVYAGPIYSIQILGAISGSGSVTAINNSGTGVGFITDASGNQVPVAFNGQTNTLPGAGQANGINGGGTIVGTTSLNGNPVVTEWLNGSATSLGIPGYGTAINNSGQVAGGFITAAGELNAFVWNNGTLVNLGTLNGGTWSSAYGINAAGHIVGTSMTGTGVFAAFFSNGSGMTSLCSSCTSNSYANTINSADIAAGSFVNSDGYLHASEYSGGNVTDLGTLGGYQSAAYGIDDNGQVVGYSYIPGDATTHGFIYSDNVMIDLNSLLPIASGWTITAAYAINGLGDVVGEGTLNGQTYAMILAPTEAENSADVPLSVPEPAPFFLMAGGLAVISRRVWHLRGSQSTSLT